MTSKIKERLINLTITVVTSFGAVFLSFSLFAGDASSVRLDKEIKEKADIEYVDKQDESIRDELHIYEDQHQIQHSAEYNALDDKLDLVIHYTKK